MALREPDAAGSATKAVRPHVRGDFHAFDFARLRGPFWAACNVLGLTLAGCGVNNIPTQEEAAKAKWSQVLNQYQRRADLIPNLVETVKGYAKQEAQVLEAVVAARARATSVQVPPTS